ncbi:MAG: hypothetical protein IT381_26590 [Deltaproteobacteria bacterium]|nr:hypothetical protein [Deltaproteobacteria bacterium]
MSDLTWEYPFLIVLALAAGVLFFSWLTRFERKPFASEFQRECPRCKLRVVGKAARDYLYCPFCAAKYPPIP